MEIISFYNQKGGVGKTTLSVSVAKILARRGKKVLYIDADPQGNSSSWLKNTKITKSFKDVIKTNTTDDCIYQIDKTLFLIPTLPGDEELRTITDLKCSSEPYLLEEILAPLSKDIDYVIFDCSPSISALERNIIVASNKMFIPIQSEQFSIEGLASTIKFISRTNEKLRSNCIFDTLLVNNVNRSLSVHKKGLKDLQELKMKHIVIPQSADLKILQMNKSFLPSNHKINTLLEEII